MKLTQVRGWVNVYETEKGEVFLSHYLLGNKERAELNAEPVMLDCKYLGAVYIDGRTEPPIEKESNE